MNEQVRAALAGALGAAVAETHPVAGGSINDAWRVSLTDGRTVFVKSHPDAAPGCFRAEADGLDWLRVPGGPPVPEVVALADPEGPGRPGPRFLALEWLEPARPAPDHDATFGRRLAAVHAAAPATFGYPIDNWVGSVPQDNAPGSDWPAFWMERRIRPLTRRAVREGRLDAAFARAVDRLGDRIADLAGPPEPPARLHGDLWSGNVHAGPDGEAWLIDPAVYGGHREVDLAMLRLFGGAPRTLAAYVEVHPLAPGHEDRVPLWQLYPLLVHVVLFGGGYVDAARTALGRYAAIA